MVKKDFESQAIIKKEQAQELEQFCIDRGLWIANKKKAKGKAKKVPDLTLDEQIKFITFFPAVVQMQLT